MNLTPLITDNITELLVKIIEFTQVRQKILSGNINNMRRTGFVPMELAVDEFTESLGSAICEHTRSHRLVLFDTENIKFGQDGNFEVAQIVDSYAKDILAEDQDEYLELQINKLLENSLNQRVAAELLRQKQGVKSIFE